MGTIAAALLLVGCGTDDDTTKRAGGPAGAATSAPPGPATPTDTEPPAGGLSEFTGVEARFEPASTSGLVLTDVRASEHDGFGRVVLEFSGTGAPGWSVNYVDRAVMDGSGDPVALEGDTVLDVHASGTTWPAPDYYDGPERLHPEGDGGLAELFVVGTFEGTTQVLVGLDGERSPFRVFALTEPSRLVVDVED